MAETHFERLNADWNADPNSPLPRVEVHGDNIYLSFHLNSYLYPQFVEDQIGHVVFRKASRYRKGSVNDEGWYMGQCRFSKLAPQWGEFYKVSGDLLLDRCPGDWISLPDPGENTQHFLFYFRDEEFECDAVNWEFKPVPPPA